MYLNTLIIYLFFHCFPLKLPCGPLGEPSIKTHVQDNTGLIKSEKHTLHSRMMASGGTPPEIWLEIVAAISCLHHST